MCAIGAQWTGTEFVCLRCEIIMILAAGTATPDPPQY